MKQNEEELGKTRTAVALY